MANGGFAGIPRPPVGRRRSGGADEYRECFEIFRLMADPTAAKIEPFVLQLRARVLEGFAKRPVIQSADRRANTVHQILIRRGHSKRKPA